MERTSINFSSVVDGPDDENVLEIVSSDWNSVRSGAGSDDERVVFVSLAVGGDGIVLQVDGFYLLQGLRWRSACYEIQMQEHVIMK